MFPVYGLAEASLAVSFPPPGSPLRHVAVDRRALGVGATVRVLEAGDRDALTIVCVGRPIPYTSIRLEDDAGEVVGSNTVGHLLIHGENVTRGYLDKVPANQVVRYERELIARLHGKHEDLLEAIRTKKALDDKLEGDLRAALDSFSETFA